MEMNAYETSAALEPVAPKKSNIHVAALVLGIIGFVLAYITYMGVIFGNIAAIQMMEAQQSQQVGVLSGVMAGADALILVLCIVALILGIMGLVRSIHRATRTVKGIVMSAISINLSVAGVIMMIIGIFLTVMFHFIGMAAY